MVDNQMELSPGIAVLAMVLDTCHEDAQDAGEKLIRNSGCRYHRLQFEVEKVPKYPRGRPPKGNFREVLRYEYHLITTISATTHSVKA
jgi:hypothetical protein